MDTLAFWGYLDPAQLVSLDLGDVAPGSSDDIQLRVTNLSNQYTAQSVTVTTAETATGEQLWLSLDGEAFGASVTLGDVPALAASAPFWLRRVTPASTTPGANSTTLTAAATGWGLPEDPTDGTPVDTDDGIEEDY